MKLEVLVANEEALKVLVETKFDNMQLVWDLSESFDEVEKAITKFQKRRDEYVKKAGVADKDNPEKFNIPDPAAFTEEMRKILDVNVEINFPVIAIDQLKGLKVSVREIRSWKALGIVKSADKLPGGISNELGDDKQNKSDKKDEKVTEEK